MNRLHAGLERAKQALVQCLLVLQFQCAVFAVEQAQAQLQLKLGDARKTAQGVLLAGAQLPRHAVDDAQGADQLAVRAGDRHTGVKADVGLAGDQRIVAKPLIPGGIGHLEQLSCLNGMGAECQLAGCLFGRQTDAALEPLALIIDQRHQCNGCVEPARGQLGQVVKRLLAGCIQNLQPRQGFQPACFPVFCGVLVVAHIDSLACPSV